MNNYNPTNQWCIVEEGFKPENHPETETDFCLGNGHIYQHANFEEYYTGETIRGSYISGLTNERLSACGKWKNNYSESFDNIINAPDWTSIIIRLNEEVLDLKTWDVINFKRTLNMLDGTLERTYEAISPKGNHIQVIITRFLSLAETEIGAIKFSVKSLNFEGRISFMPLIDGNLENNQNNINELTWNVLQSKAQHDVAHLWVHLRRIDFHICGALSYIFKKNHEQLNYIPTKIEKEKTVGYSIGTDVKTGDRLTLEKYVAMITSADTPKPELTQKAGTKAREAKQKGWDQLLNNHKVILNAKWAEINDTANNEYNQIQTEERYKAFKSFLSIE